MGIIFPVLFKLQLYIALSTLVNLKVSLVPVASQIIDIIDMVIMYKNYLPLMQMNHCIVEVFTISVVLIRNQKVITNIVANMSLVEIIKEVIIRQTWDKSETFCWFCCESNHTASVCRHGTYITCNTCNMTGHKSKRCTYY